jgi:Cof subfamily protein (haloacid dehalogenase superfamily)
VRPTKEARVPNPLAPLPPRLIATDLDGTLLQGDGTISTRTRYALIRVRAHGIPVVMVTGRPPRHVRQLAGTAQLAEVVICMNGALTYDLDARQVLDETRLPASPAQAVVQALRRLFPEICFAVEVGLAFGWEPRYGRERGKVELSEFPAEDALVLCEGGVNKLIAFSSTRPLSELLAGTLAVVTGQALVTTSGAPFLEISALEANKASALARYCARLGVDRGNVWAFGDMPNDLAMLRWAGHSVAVANAHPDVLGQVDEVTTSNDDHGVARVLERLVERLDEA